MFLKQLSTQASHLFLGMIDKMTSYLSKPKLEPLETNMNT
jgi:hypothetical protein